MWNLRFLQQCCWRVEYCGMLHCVARWIVPHVLNECNAFIPSSSGWNLKIISLFTQQQQGIAAHNTWIFTTYFIYISQILHRTMSRMHNMSWLKQFSYTNILICTSSKNKCIIEPSPFLHTSVYIHSYLLTYGNSCTEWEWDNRYSSKAWLNTFILRF